MMHLINLDIKIAVQFIVHLINLVGDRFDDLFKARQRTAIEEVS